MMISTKGRYALRVMVELAAATRTTGPGHEADAAYIPLRDIAAGQDISEKYLESIVRVMVQHGLLTGLRGKGGGYRLARPASGYTVGDILRATEGNLSPINCLEDDMNMCPRSMACPTLRFWAGLDRVIGEYVDSVTLEDLLREDTSDDSMKREGEDRDGEDKQEHN